MGSKEETQSLLKLKKKVEFFIFRFNHYPGTCMSFQIERDFVI